jgi:hypothetical protein
MDPWALLAAYAVVIVVLQMLVYLYYRRRSGQSDGRTVRPSIVDHEGSPTSQAARGTVTDGETDDDREMVPCPHCGAPNEADSVYTYCHNCLGELGR